MRNCTIHCRELHDPEQFAPIQEALVSLGQAVQAVPDYQSGRIEVTMPEDVSVDALIEAVRRTGAAFHLHGAPTAPAEKNASASKDCACAACAVGVSLGEPAVLSVPEMDCPVEAGAIEREFKKVGLPEAVFDTMNRVVRFQSISPTGLQKAVSAVHAAGYEAAIATAAAAGVESRTLIAVPAMDCPVEEGMIRKVFEAESLTQYSINLLSRTIAVPDAEVGRALSLIARAGFRGEALKKQASHAQASIVFEDQTPWKRYFAALAVALLSEAVDLAAEYGAWPINVQAADMLSLAAAAAAILMVGLSTFKKGIQAALHGTLNMNALMAVAVTGGVLIGAWPEAAMVMVLFEISEAIEQLSMSKARSSIRDLMSAAPETALVRSGGAFVKKNVRDVCVGDVIRAAPGDRVPLDGQILSGRTSIDQSMVTGESMPADKAPGDRVYAGTVNLSAAIDVLVTAEAGQSLTARIIEAVENAQASKSKVQRFVDRFASVYTPIVFAFAAAVALLPPIFLGDWLGWLYKGLCLLVIACPCALVISTPVTIISALAAATRCGLLIKGGLFLEEARKLKNVGLDKTGTLTKGEPQVARIQTFGIDQNRALSLAASLGAMNKHPLSAAIVRAAKEADAGISSVEDFRALPGIGVSGRIGRGTLSLMNAKGVQERGLMTTAAQTAFQEAEHQGMSASALVDAFGVLAVFAMADEIKPDAQEGLEQLAAEGITPVLLTGDNGRAAAALAQKLGLQHVAANLLPEDKLARIHALKKSGLTAMAGDGINDAPALAAADIGIAMGIRGTDSAIDAADVALMDDRISSIASLVRLSRMTHAVLIQNIVFALGIKAVFAVLAVAGMATMWMAVFADTGTCLIVVANGLRMLRAKDRLDRMTEEVRRRARPASSCPVEPAAA